MQKEKVFCPSNLHKSVLAFLRLHAKMNPLIAVHVSMFFSQDDTYRFAETQAYEFCKQHDLVGLWGYLWCSWYCPQQWVMMAPTRSGYGAAMPLASTTNITEAHWRLLKRDYKYSCNQPRLDRLTQIICSLLISNLQVKEDRYAEHKEFPSWWLSFTKIWLKAKCTVHSSASYHTDLRLWVCFCPSFLHSPYNICKHLVSLREFTYQEQRLQYSETFRRYNRSFIQFGPTNGVMELMHESHN